MSNQSVINFRVFHSKKFIHITIPKNASTSQGDMTVKDPGTITHVIVGETTDVPETINNTSQGNREYFENYYSDYKKSCFIRDPIDRFASGLVQDYSALHLRNDDSLPSYSQAIHDFKKSLSIFVNDPSWENLLYALRTDKKLLHVSPQYTYADFDALPDDMVYFDVDQYLTDNYVHWLSDHNLSEFDQTELYNKLKTLDVNSSASPTYFRGEHLKNFQLTGKKMVSSYFNYEPMISWVREFYQADIEMYNCLKPKCYRKGQSNGS